MKRATFLLLLVLLAGCEKRPYTFKRELLTAQISKIKSAVEKAKPLMPSSLGPFDGDGDGKGAPTKLDTPLRLGGVRSEASTAPLANALLLPVEEIAKLGDASAWHTNGYFDVDWSISCLRQATLVLEKDECGSTSCNSEWAARCAEYLLGLRYVLVLKTDHYNDIDSSKAVSGSERYAGRAVLVELGSMQTWPVIAFSGDRSNVGVSFRRDYQDPIPVALGMLGERLTTRFPGATAPAEWFEKPKP